MSSPAIHTRRHDRWGRFASVREALSEIAAGRMLVVVDDERRENEGDLVMAAEFVTPQALSFMTREAGGWICLALTGDRCDRLGLRGMSASAGAEARTPFTVTFDAAGGVRSGASLQDQARSIRVALDPDTGPEGIVVGGHIQPLRSRPTGVLERAGHTEAAVDLASLAGLTPAGLICEIQNVDGSMARLGDLEAYCRRHDLRILRIADLIAYRRDSERSLVAA